MDLLQETPVDYSFSLRSSAGSIQFDNMMVEAPENYVFDDLTCSAPAGGDLLNSAQMHVQVKPEPYVLAAGPSWPSAAAPAAQEATITLVVPKRRPRGRPPKVPAQAVVATEVATKPTTAHFASKASSGEREKPVPLPSQTSSDESDDETEPSSTDKNSKNREAAQQFRHRQREHIKRLEDQVARYTQQNETFNDQVSRLQEENKVARQQVTLLREFINQAMSFAFSNLSQSILEQQLAQMKAQLGQLPAVQAQMQRFQPAVAVAQS